MCVCGGGGGGEEGNAPSLLLIYNLLISIKISHVFWHCIEGVLLTPFLAACEQ